MSHLMVMIGKSGKKTKLLSFKNMNNNSNLIVLFDSPSDFDDLDKMISKNKPKIISFDYDTHRILKDKKNLSTHVQI